MPESGEKKWDEHQLGGHIFTDTVPSPNEDTFNKLLQFDNGQGIP